MHNKTLERMIAIILIIVIALALVRWGLNELRGTDPQDYGLF